MSAHHLHCIPVDPSLTVEDAWRELCLMGVRATDTGEPSWANVWCDGEECGRISSDELPVAFSCGHGAGCDCYVVRIWPGRCESCGQRATERLADGSHWCAGCHAVALAEGY